MGLYRWVVLYNANLDRSPNNRKTTVELKKDLKKWEEERPKKKKPVVSDVLGYQVLINISSLILFLSDFFFGYTWTCYQITHKTEFSRLVDAARQTANGKMTTPISISSGELASNEGNPQIVPTSPPWIIISVKTPW